MIVAGSSLLAAQTAIVVSPLSVSYGRESLIITNTKFMRSFGLIRERGIKRYVYLALERGRGIHLPTSSEYLSYDSPN